MAQRHSWRITIAERAAAGDLAPALHTIGHVDPGAAMPLFAYDVTGWDVTDRLFRMTPDGAVIIADDVTPMMMTTTVHQARRDCLFYTASPVDIGKG